MSGKPALAVSSASRMGGRAPARLRRTATELVENGLASAAVALVAGEEGEPAWAAAGAASGRSSGAQPLFDLASVSKPWTASLALRLDHRGLLPLSTELGEVWTGCDRRLARRTLEELLRHRAGLQPWTPLYRRCRKPSTVARLLVGGRLLGARRDTYGDLDYVLWGLSAERALGRSLGALLRDQLLRPLGLRAAPTSDTFWLPCMLGNEREVELAATQGIRVGRLGPPAAGRVQDGNARFLGAPAGHAGLFATPGALLALAREWLVPGALWPVAAVERALSGPGSCLLGWRRATRRNSGGRALGPGSFGHVGFTGGSIWLDPGRQRILILLAHRTGCDVELAPARRRFHAMVSAS